MLVREPAPAHQITAVSTDGRRFRWAADEMSPARIPSGAQWSTSVPGGADTFNCTLPRDPERAYSDLGLLSEIQVSRNGGRTLRYRLEDVPRVSGEQMAVEPSAKGYRAALEDRSDVTALFVSRDLSRWQGMSRARRIALLSASPAWSLSDFATTVDPGSGEPGIDQALDGSWDERAISESWFDAGDGNTVAQVYTEWEQSGIPSGYTAQLFAPSTDASAGADSSADQADGSASGTLTFTPTTPRRWAMARVHSDTAAATAEVSRRWFWKKLAAYGDHGLTTYGDDPGGFYTGQMLEWLIANQTNLGTGTVEDGTFIHSHAAFHDPSTPLSIVENLTRVEPLYDWFVYDTFEFRRRGTYGKRWRARVGPSGLRGTGQSIGRLFNEIAVRVDDPLFGSVTIGPTGSSYAQTSDYLIDTDSANPANQAGVSRRYLLDVGEGTTDGAIEVGRRFLEETKRLDNSGQCELVGFVEDESGIAWPVDEVRAGDEISFSDSADTSYRRISATSYSQDSHTNSLTIDAPAQTMEGLLARLQAVLVPLN